MGKSKTKTVNPDRLPIGKFLAWRGGAFSLAANFIIMGYLTIYCTDTLMLPAGLIGMILLGSKILDAVGELYAGFLIDNTKTKLGKGRPYELLFFGLWISTVLLFSTPQSFGIVGKSIWVLIFYALVMSVFQTLIQAASMPYMMRAFTSKLQMVKLQSYGGIVGTVLSITVSVSFPRVVAMLTTAPGGWTKVVTIFAIPLLIIGLTRFLFVKEVVTIETDGAKQESLKLKDIFEVLKMNKYIWIICGLTLLIQIMAGMNAGTYYFKYIVGDLGQYGTVQMVSMALLIVMVFFPKIIKRFSVSTLIGAGAVAGMIGGIIIFFAKDNMALLMLGVGCTGFATLSPSYLIPLMIMDAAKYNILKGHKSMEATMASVNNFGTNIGSGIGSAMVGIFLGVTGYVGNVAEQTAAATLTIRALYSIIPTIVFIVIFIMMRKFDLEKKLPQLQKEHDEAISN